ncbi:Ribose transport system permease protein RbsC [Maioricimonas rarisocia]|uniref:Ribose transport system permease protein RbsC n=1 Tax=Maioricimonas rarisocia TaxID=2528026 RepID=A0A517ZFI9_9PLAN|nr:ABC transporter permease [Maioricimonas rarisocia]QDU41202.1 Ribose transport system permease protein RbsC [Maioricimonas rarisocia]
MSEQHKTGWLANPFIRDYGMVFVLLLLGLLFSALTIREQHPTGGDAGRQVADFILDQHGESAAVLIVGRPTAEDREFTTAAAERLEEKGATVLATVNGSAVDARKAIEAILADGGTIDAIAANDVTAKWTVYDRFESVGAEKTLTPSPYTWPDFLKVTNLLGVANQTAIYAIIAIGMTMVIITAGIDLSVGSLVALASVSSAILIRDLGGGSDAAIGMVLVGVLAGIVVCGLAGVFNGLMVTAFGIPPFIVTLGMMMMASGLSFRLAEGRSIPELPTAFFWLGRGQTLGIPNPVLLMIVLYIIAHIVMSQMVFGRYVYAIGGNEEAARLSGVPVKRVLLAVYTICGALAGLGGIVLTSQLSAGDPKFGLMYELEVIAAVVVGGTSLMGGQGKILGTLIGAFIIAVIKNGMNLTDVDPFNQKIVLGAVLTGAVLLDTLKRRGGRS